MPQPVTTLICFAALIAVVAASRFFGRLAGMFAAATCGVSLAYVMPPAYSFDVDSILDQTILAAYGAVSVLLLMRKPATRRRPLIFEDSSGALLPESGTSLSTIVEKILPASGIPIFIGDLNVAARADEAETVLRAVFQAALAEAPVERLSVYGGRRPGVDRIWVAAQYRELPDQPCVLAAGQKDCVSAPFSPGTVTWFDNGFERVYQISLPR